MSNATNKNKLPLRLTSCKDAETASARLTAATTAIAEYADKKESRTVFEAMFAKATPEQKKALEAFTQSADFSPEDSYRVASAEYVCGVYANIANYWKAKADNAEAFLIMDEVQARAEVRDAQEIYKNNAKLFPLKHR